MGLRASIQEVRDMLADEEAVVLPQLIMANEIVDVWLLGKGLGANTLRHIEIFLTCHLYSQAVADIVRETYDGATFEYPRTANVFDKGFASTKWGQMAIALDTSGTLRGVGRTPVTIYVL